MHGDGDELGDGDGGDVHDGEKHMIVGTHSDVLQHLHLHLGTEELGMYRNQTVLDTRRRFPSDLGRIAECLRASEEP